MHAPAPSPTLPAMDWKRAETSFRLQAAICKYFGSDLYAGLMTRAHEDLVAGGPTADLVERFSGDPLRGFLALRVFGAVHARVLAGAAPELAAYYPTAGGRADPEAAWPAFLDVVARDRDALRERLERAPQTNEVRRCAGLLGGFLQIAAATDHPLHLLELGCSAGLNLQWNRFRYNLGAWEWGDEESSVEITTRWRGAVPDDPVQWNSIQIAARQGCDLAPRSIDSEDALRDLECFVWADQPDRLNLLRAAVELARRDPPKIDRAAAGDWLPNALATVESGECAVVYHSSVWTYLPQSEQQQIVETLEAHGAGATRDRPLAWLRAEDSEDGTRIELRLRRWPGGDEQLLGEGHPHGTYVRWYQDATY